MAGTGGATKMKQALREHLALFLVLIVAAVVRLVGLGVPDTVIWDEQYYASDSYSYLGGTPDLSPPDAPPQKIPNERTWEHPPLAKELIALGEGPVGFRPRGFRAPGAAFGVVEVGALYGIARRLRLTRCWSAVSAGFVTIDGLAIVQSRVAMLDGFATAFCLVSLLLVLEWRRSHRTFDVVAAGLFTGAAVASKWSVLPLTILIALGALAAGSRTTRGVLRWGAAFVLAPALVYVAAYGPFWAAHGPDAVGFVQLQHSMLDKQDHNKGLSPDRSSAWTWPIMAKPVRYYPGPQDSKPAREVLALGNPALWWGFLVVVPLSAVGLVRRRRAAAAVGVAGYLATWAPWLVTSRTTYFYYMTPVVPFMALLTGSALSTFEGRRRYVAGAFVVGVSVVGAAFLPLWLGVQLLPWSHRLRWLASWV